MPRRLELDQNGDLQFPELVWDDDAENVDHPLPSIVELAQIDGAPVPDAEKTPSWLVATVDELGVNAQKERWEEEVTVTIRDAEQNLDPNTVYTFRLRATDGIDTTDRLVNLEVE